VAKSCCAFFLHSRLPKEDVSVDDAFIVRYGTDSQRGLAFHRDGISVVAKKKKHEHS